MSCMRTVAVSGVREQKTCEVGVLSEDRVVSLLGRLVVDMRINNNISKSSFFNRVDPATSTSTSLLLDFDIQLFFS